MEELELPACFTLTSIAVPVSLTLARLTLTVGVEVPSKPEEAALRTQPSRAHQIQETEQVEVFSHGVLDVNTASTEVRRAAVLCCW